jgi:hypothetical protein
MTTSRCELVDVDRVTWRFLQERLPETIAIAISWEDRPIIEGGITPDGRMQVRILPQETAHEFDQEQLIALLIQCRSELREWRERLCGAGEAWAQ